MAENDPKGMAPDPRRTQRKVWTPDSAESAQADPRATQRKVWTPETSGHVGTDPADSRATQRINPVAGPTKPTEPMQSQRSYGQTSGGAGHAAEKKKSKAWLWILLAVVIVLGGGVASWFFMNSGSKPRIADDEDENAAVELPALDEYERPEQAESLNYYSDADAEQPLIEMEVLQEEPVVIAIADEPRNNEIRAQEEIQSGPDDLDRNTASTQTVNDEPRADRSADAVELSMAMVEQKPLFPGGDAAMYKWLGEQIHYPADAAEEGVQGRVVVQFVVKKDGSIADVKVVRGKHPSLDREAVRIVKAMPRWSPGRNNGQPVNVSYTLPITFKLQN